MRSPSALSDVSAKPSFLRTTPAKNPRTECCCQPVAFIMSAIVVPVGSLSSARTASCLVPRRREGEGVSPGFARRFTRFLVRVGLALFDALPCDILGSFRLRRHLAPSPPKPQSGGVASGAGIQIGPTGPHKHGHTDARSVVEVQSFQRGPIGPEFWPSRAQTGIFGLWIWNFES